MYKYIKFAALGAFLMPGRAYWIYLAALAAVCAFMFILPRTVGLDKEYTAPEQIYDMQIGYIMRHGIPIPKRVYIRENGQKRTIPERDVSFKLREDGIYDVYARIKRRDGDGYDYVSSVLKRIGRTEYEVIETVCGKEIMR